MKKNIDQKESGSWSVNFYVNSNPWRASIVTDLEVNVAEYAFYLMRDKERVATRWYTSEPSASFTPKIASGNYHIIGFVRRLTKKLPVILESSKVFQKFQEDETEADTEVSTRWKLPVFQGGEFPYGNLFKDDGLYKLKFYGQSAWILVKNSHFFETGNNFFLVCFHGAISNRSEKEYPFFAGLNICELTNLPLISISDPTISMAEDLALGWYAGNSKSNLLQKDIANIIELISNKYNSTPILFGGSGGGFAALNTILALNCSAKAVVWNPQTSISEYYPNPVKKYLNSAFSFPAKTSNKKELSEYLNKTGVSHDLTKSSQILNNFSLDSKKELVYLQNNTDAHFHDHAIPFLKKFDIKIHDSYTILAGNNFIFHVGQWGDGHVPPEKFLITGIIEKLINSSNLINIAEDLSANYSKKEILSISKLLKTSPEIVAEIDNGFVIGKLIFPIEFSSKYKEELRFAFYILDSGKRIGACEYSYESSFRFYLPKKYNSIQIVAFIKDSSDNNRIEKKDVLVGAYLLNNIKKLYRQIIYGNYSEQNKYGFFARADTSRLEISPDMSWRNKDRNVEFSLHAWRFLPPIWNKFFETGEVSYVFQIIDLIRSWERQSNSIKKSPLTWYNMASGIRAIHLSLLLELINFNIFKSNDDLIKLINSLSEKHLVFLCDKKNIGVGNHAVWQIIGLKSVSRALKIDKFDSYINELLEDYVFSAFDENFINKENSPFYHEYNLYLLKFLRKDIFPECSDKIENLLKEGSKNTVWLTGSDGNFFRIGDTEGAPSKVGTLSNEDVRFSVNDANIVCKDFSISGYQLIRSADDFNKNKSFSFLFHVPVGSIHFHADHLSFIFFKEGIELFSDPGKYTYENNLMRNWFVCDKAHNTLGLEGKTYFPSDFISGFSQLKPLVADHGSVALEGSACIGGDFKHIRRINFTPYSEIIIVDAVENFTESSFELRFNFGPEVKCFFIDEVFNLMSGDRLVGKMIFQNDYMSINHNCIADDVSWISYAYHQKKGIESIWLKYPFKTKKIVTKIILDV